MPTTFSLTKISRTREMVEELINLNGFYHGARTEFAQHMADIHGPWRQSDGTGNYRLLKECMALTKDQQHDPNAVAVLGGFVVSYAPATGGIVLLQPSGEMALEHMLHLLSGDLLRQQVTKTVNQRRDGVWGSAYLSCAKAGDLEVARLCAAAQNEIQTTGFVSGSVVQSFLAAMRQRGYVT